MIVIYISSVLVEKAIDLLVCRRLKLRGQNWSRQGADNLLVFRQMMLNDQWQNYWPGRKTAWVSHTHTISHAYRRYFAPIFLLDLDIVNKWKSS